MIRNSRSHDPLAQKTSGQCAPNAEDANDEKSEDANAEWPRLGQVGEGNAVTPSAHERWHS
jgi:hypothetical protein